MNDPVNHPGHYTDGPIHTTCGEPIECIDVSSTMDFCLGNVIKYIWRSGKKDATRTIEDLKKARWYLDHYIYRLETRQAKLERQDDES